MAAARIYCNDEGAYKSGPIYIYCLLDIGQAPDRKKCRSRSIGVGFVMWDWNTVRVPVAMGACASFVIMEAKNWTMVSWSGHIVVPRYSIFIRLFNSYFNIFFLYYNLKVHDNTSYIIFNGQNMVEIYIILFSAKFLVTCA